MGVQQIASAEDLQNVIASSGNKLVVVDFYATWCGPCKKISPVFEALSNEYPNVVFVRVDVDEAGDAAADHGVEAMPTFKYFKNGQRVDEVVGANDTELKSKISKHHQ